LQEATKKGDPSITAKLQAELNTTLLQIPEQYRDLIASSGSLKEAQNSVSQIITQEGSKIQQQNVSAGIAAIVQSSYNFADALENSADTLIIGIAKIISNNDEALDQVLKERKRKDIFSTSESGNQKGRELGASLFAGLSLENQNKVIEDLNNGNIKLSGTQTEVIDKLKNYGLSIKDLNVLNSLTEKDLEILSKGFISGANSVKKSTVEFSDNIKKAGLELSNMSEIVKLIGETMNRQGEYARSLAYMDSQGNRNNQIENAKGVAGINALTGDKFSQIRDQGIVNEAEIFSKGQDELFNAQQKYYSTSEQLQNEFASSLFSIQSELSKGNMSQEEASLKTSESLVPYAIKQEQANQELLSTQETVQKQTEQSLRLDSIRNDYLRRQAEILKDISLAGGAEGYLNYSELDQIAQIELNKKIADDFSASPDTRGRAAGRILKDTIALTGETNRPEYEGLEKMFIEGRAANLQAIGQKLNQSLGSFGAENVTSRLTGEERFIAADRQAASLTGRPLMGPPSSEGAQKGYEKQFLGQEELKQINQQTLQEIIKNTQGQIDAANSITDSVLNSIQGIKEPLNILTDVTQNGNIEAIKSIDNIFPNQTNIDIPLSSIGSQIDSAVAALGELSSQIANQTAALSSFAQEQAKQSSAMQQAASAATQAATTASVATNVANNASAGTTKLNSVVQNLAAQVSSVATATKSIGQSMSLPSVMPSSSGPSSSYSPGATDLVSSNYSNTA
jgi:hypothetical protein